MKLPSRWYLSRFRRLAEKTDAGRVLLPSAARAVDSVLNGGSSSGGESTSTAEVWGAAERVLSGAAEYFENPRSESSYLWKLFHQAAAAAKSCG